ncbi:MAG: hypothetical protein OXF11_21660 [Deltaproteobacteria bacterium]|nr:hypothetical protein [Deltaproteobacteria bacterium]
MAQPSNEKKLPKDLLKRGDHDIMEHLFGKRIMKEVDKIVAERSQEDDNDPNMS